MSAAAAPLTQLAGVGPARARSLARMGLEDARDLLLYAPRRLESTGEALPIAAACQRVGSVVVVRGVVAKVRFQRFGRRSTLRFVLADESGEIEVVYHNQAWQRERFAAGDERALAGRVAATSRGAALASPRAGDDARPLPAPGGWLCVYPVTAGIGQALVRGLCRQALERFGDELEERLPAEALARLGLPPLPEAAAALHAPPSPAAFGAARRRALLESLLAIQARVMARRSARTPGRAVRVPIDAARHAELVARFGFELTPGQGAVAGELRRDLARRAPMRRLLQGDVGSGKTALGVYACMAAVAAGSQAAFMAPTELLCEQHYYGLRPMLERAGVVPALLTGSLRVRERRRVLAGIAAGTIDLVFGTHALFSADVRYRGLALAVIDEQQRFGVAQRARLMEKGRDVHVLLMTATPIPRTLALTIYGDLDTSLLRGAPPGRGALRTRWLRAEDARRTVEFLLERLRAGERVFWVSPRIGEAEESGAVRAYERLKRSPLSDFGLELVHGRLAPGARAQRLERFRRGDSAVLVATTVIEVGVDVPEATVMVIEDSERLGLAQLHQLRGRIGRGPRESWCLLYGRPSGAARLELLERCQDGFELSEEDLRRRGMGDLAGLRQSGDLGDLGAAGGDVEDDLDLLVAARDLLLEHPALAGACRESSPEPVRVHAP